MDKTAEKIFIFAGEPSGDLHGSHLVQTLKNLTKDFSFEGVAGPLMRKQDVRFDLKMEDFAVMGFSDVFFSLPSLIVKFYKVRNHILKTNPKAVILIDYPGFNLRLAKHLRKKGYAGKIIQYISPTVWAWGKKRIHHMVETLDLLLTIYPFEKDYFAETPLKVEYVGHPCFKKIEDHVYTPFEVQNDHLIALFPGSRIGEIKRNLQKILKSLKVIKQNEPKTKFALSIANDSFKPTIHQMIAAANLEASDFIFVPKNKTYELMQSCRSAIAKSGTVTLELALHKKPTVVVYELSILNRFIAKYIMGLNLPFYCIVNILNKAEVFPELIEHEFTAENLSSHLSELHSDGIKRQACMDECEKVIQLLEIDDPSKKAALSIIQELSC